MIKDILITAVVSAMVFCAVSIIFWMSYDVKVPPVAEICHDCIERDNIKTALIKTADDLADVQALLLLIVVDNQELIKKRSAK